MALLKLLAAGVPCSGWGWVSFCLAPQQPRESWQVCIQFPGETASFPGYLPRSSSWGHPPPPPTWVQGSFPAGERPRQQRVRLSPHRGALSPVTHLPGWLVPCSFPAVLQGPASHLCIQGPNSSHPPTPSWGHDLFCATDPVAFGGTFIPCLVCKCITNASSCTGSQLI